MTKGKIYDSFSSYPLWVLLLFVIGSCSTGKYLGDDEFLLKRNDVSLLMENGDIGKKGKEDMIEDIGKLMIQKPNTNFFIVFPREWYYLKNRSKADTGFLGKFSLNNIAEVPTFFDTTALIETKSRITNFLRSQGYWQAATLHDVEFGRHTASVTYSANPGPLYKVDSFIYISEDKQLLPFIQKPNSKISLAKGNAISRNNYSAEIRRITNELRNNGYYEFYPNYISNIQVYDSTEHEVYMGLKIENPPDQDEHTSFQIRDIYIYPDYDPLASPDQYSDTLISGITFRYRTLPIVVKPALLLGRLESKPGDIYNQKAFENTINALGVLSIFKFPNIRVQVNAQDSASLDYHILLRQNKKLAAEGDFGLAYSTISSANQLIGLSAEGNWINRNAFGNSERLNFNLELGIETSLRRDFSSILNIAPSLELNTNKFNDFPGTLRLLNKWKFGGKRLISDQAYQSMEKNASTNLRLDFRYFDNQDFYTYNSFNAAYQINFRLNNNRDFKLSLMGINYLSPKEKNRFDEIAGENELFRSSFDKQLLTGFLFRDLNYTKSGNVNRYGEQLTRNFIIETSGLESAAIIGLFGNIKGLNLNDRLTIGEDTIRFSQFVRLEGEYRYTKRLTELQSLAARANIGMALPFGPNQAIPYVKKFYIGGPYSLRAWQIRELGPGENRDTTALTNNVPFYQAGDLKIELNLEYRFDLFWLLEGAVFLDVGNIWNLDKDAENQTRFYLDQFWKQFAIGTGLGMRLDFTFFILRADFGYPIKNNYKDESGSYLAVKRWSDVTFDKFNLNIGVNYPF